MRVWFTSDTHFGHTNIISYCNRPFKTVEEMNERIINNWNSKVDYKDKVFFLGDLTFITKTNHFLNRLNGQIIWIKGNHDKNQPIKKVIINYGGIDWELVHNPIDAVLSNYVLCGHVHEKWKSKKEGERIFINVGVDVWNFTPISIEEILKELEETK